MARRPKKGEPAEKIYATLLCVGCAAWFFGGTPWVLGAVLASPVIFVGLGLIESLAEQKKA